MIWNHSCNGVKYVSNPPLFVHSHLQPTVWVTSPVSQAPRRLGFWSSIQIFQQSRSPVAFTVVQVDCFGWLLAKCKKWTHTIRTWEASLDVPVASWHGSTSPCRVHCNGWPSAIFCSKCGNGRSLFSTIGHIGKLSSRSITFAILVHETLWISLLPCKP